jgi:hypothetical protein
LHRANATLLLGFGLLACASGGQHAALGWSLGGEAHVFVADDRFARDFYRQLSQGKDLMDALEGRPLVAVDARNSRSVTVLSANGAAPARVTVARFHAPRTCGSPAIVTELVLAFPAGGAGGRSTPPSHVTVVALLDEPAFAGGAGPRRARLTRAAARDLVNRVAARAESVSRGTRATLLRQLSVDPDQAADAGEVVALGSDYAVGFRARYVTAASDTTLVTGVAATDVELRELRWVIRPQRLGLHGEMIRSPAGRPAVRYSVRGAVAGSGGDMMLLLDEIADVSTRDSRATAVDVTTRRLVAAQPLALRCL